MHRLALGLTGVGALACLVSFVALILTARGDDPSFYRTLIVESVGGVFLLGSVFVLIILFSIGPAV